MLHATTSYKHPSSLYRQGQLRSFLMRSGSWAVGLYENLTKERGMKPLVAMAVLVGAGMVVGLFLIVVIGLLLMSKMKQD